MLNVRLVKASLHVHLPWTFDFTAESQWRYGFDGGGYVENIGTMFASLESLEHKEVRLVTCISQG